MGDSVVFVLEERSVYQCSTTMIFYSIENDRKVPVKLLFNYENTSQITDILEEADLNSELVIQVYPFKIQVALTSSTWPQDFQPKLNEEADAEIYTCMPNELKIFYSNQFQRYYSKKSKRKRITDFEFSFINHSDLVDILDDAALNMDLRINEYNLKTIISTGNKSVSMAAEKPVYEGKTEVEIITLKRSNITLWFTFKNKFLFTFEGERRVKVNTAINFRGDLANLKEILENAEINDEISIEKDGRFYNLICGETQTIIDKSKEIEKNPEKMIPSIETSEADSKKPNSKIIVSGDGDLIEKKEKALETVTSPRLLNSPKNSSLGESELKYFCIYESKDDISENYIIKKLNLNEKSYHKLGQTLPEKGLKIIGAYGEEDCLVDFVKKCFNVETIKKLKPGLTIICKNEQAIIVYLSDKKNLYRDRPLLKAVHEALPIRILSDLCCEIYPCISETNLCEWFFEGEGTKNPYNKSSFEQQETDIKQRDEEAIANENIKVDQRHFIKSSNSSIAISQDDSQIVYIWNFEKHVVDDVQKSVLKKEIFDNILRNLNDHWKLNRNVKNVVLKYGKELEIENLVKKINEFIDIYKNEKTKIAGSIKQEIITFVLNHSSLKNNSANLFSFIDRYESLTDFIKKVKEKVKQIYSSSNYVPFMFSSLDKHSPDFFEELKNAVKTLEVEYKGIDKGLLYDSKLSHKKAEEIFAEFYDNVTKEDADVGKCFIKYLKGYFNPNIYDYEFYEFCDQERLENNRIASERDRSITDFLVNQIFDLSCPYLYNLCISRVGIVKNTLNLEKSFEKVLLLKTASELKLKQIITDTKQNIIFVSVNDSTNTSTKVFTLQIEQKFKNNFIPKVYNDTDLLIANGSSLQKYVFILNTDRKCKHGSVDYHMHIGEPIESKIFHDNINRITCAQITSKRKLLFLCDKGNFYEHTLKEDGSSLLIKTTRNDTQIPFKPMAENKIFSSFQAINEEKVYFFRTEDKIEYYDENLCYSKTLNIDSCGKEFKVINSGLDVYVMFKSKDIIKAHYMKIKDNSFYAFHHKIEVEKPKGNPIIDILHISWMKFGEYNKYSSVVDGQRKVGYYCQSGEKSEIEDYLYNLMQEGLKLNVTGFVDLDSPFRRTKIVSKSDLLFVIVSSTPLHLASINQSKLIPLKNGNNNYESFMNIVRTILASKQNLTKEMYKYLKFGLHEDELIKQDNVKIFAIIGRQSSGKSYLMNRIFGTRFDVSAQRCTEGIWMSIAKIDGKCVLILDCEGLFSVERTETEEGKLCLFLAALSDELVINSDLSSNKHLIDLFDKIIVGNEMSQLSDKFFKGYLNITYRDIMQGQDTGANEEYAVFVEKLTKRYDKSLTTIFNGKIINTLYHTIIANEFVSDVNQSRAKMMSRSNLNVKGGIRFSGREAVDNIKMLLVQIYSGDYRNIQQLLFESEIDDKTTLFNNLLKGTKSLKESVNISHKFSHEGVHLEFSAKVTNCEFPKANRFKFFLDLCIGAKNSKEFKNRFHNEWIKNVEIFIQNYLQARNSLILAHMQKELESYGSEESFKGRLEKVFQDYHKELEISKQKFTFCKLNCRKCESFCIKRKGHAAAEECDCETDHRCHFECEFNCKEAFCQFSNSHSQGRHFCDAKGHHCEEKCDKCDRICTKEILHQSQDHNCGITHLCGEKCQNPLCNSKCTTDTDISKSDHIHRCKAPTCDAPCYFSTKVKENHKLCKIPCDQDHLHMVCEKNSYHLCNNTHECAEVCQEKGICNVTCIPREKIIVLDGKEYANFDIQFDSERRNCKKLFWRSVLIIVESIDVIKQCINVKPDVQIV